MHPTGAGVGVTALSDPDDRRPTDRLRDPFAPTAPYPRRGPDQSRNHNVSSVTSVAEAFRSGPAGSGSQFTHPAQ
ncbi:hypothetical protein GCM10009818_03730 [Nakamurella flavida]